MKSIFLIFLIVTWWLPDCIPAQNAPVSTAGTLATVGSVITIPITAANFSNILSCNLELNYDTAIAKCTSVVTGPLTGGNLSSDLSVAGKVSLGWYTSPGLTLEGSPVLFNVSFTRIDNGTTTLTWHDDGYSCVFYDGNFNLLNDLPTQTYYIDGSLTFLPQVAPVITIPSLKECAGVNIDVPLFITDFTDVGKFTLTLHYAVSAITYHSFTNDSGFTGLNVEGTTPGIIVASGIVPDGLSGITLPDNAILFSLHFTVAVGSTLLTWSDDGISCEFKGPPPDYVALSDLPQNIHYVDGSVTQLSLPGYATDITGPAGGKVYRGQNDVILNVAGIPGATGYTWSLPQGINMTGDSSNSNRITVSVGNTFKNGFVTVNGYNSCGNGAVSPPFQLTDTTSLGIADPGNETNGSGADRGLTIESYPNPSSGKITICYILPIKGLVVIEIMNILGEKVATLIDHIEQEGNQRFQVVTNCLEPGIYNARIMLKTNKRLMITTRKIICIK